METPTPQNVQRPEPLPPAAGSAYHALTKIESELREKAKTVMKQGDRPGFVRLAAMADGTKVARDRIVESFAQWLKQPAEPFIDERMGLVNRITQYLCVGGLVNPEMMEHDKVRALLMDVRDYLLVWQFAPAQCSAATSELSAIINAARERGCAEHGHEIKWLLELPMTDEEWKRFNELTGWPSRKQRNNH